ncbi:MAG: very short patch repair endonuclease [Labrenzia sp.]
MADILTPERRSKNMSAIRSKGMKPEMIVRKLVFSLDYRYRLHRKDMPGKPDLVFGPKKKAIFVHGCFWHQHHDPNCKDGRMPKSRLEYWVPKLERNRARDKASLEALAEQGWDCLVIWECETKELSQLESRILQFLED